MLVSILVLLTCISCLPVSQEEEQSTLDLEMVVDANDSAQNPQEPGRDAGCILPKPQLAVPVASMQLIYPDGVEEPFFLPGEEYNLVSTSPFGLDVAEVAFFAPADMLWIETGNGIFSYNLKKDEWQEFKRVNDSETHITSLMRGADGTVWGYGHESFSAGEPILSKYDPASNQFLAVVDENGLLTESNYKPVGRLVQTSDGVIWMVLAQGNTSYLYTYDPETNQTREEGLISSSSSRISGPILGPDADSLTYLSLWQSWPDRCEHKVGQAQFEARQTVERDRQAALEKA